MALLSDLLATQQSNALKVNTVDVVDSTARLELTTATVRAGDFVREVGRAEIAKLTCLGSTYTAGVAETTEITCNGQGSPTLAGTCFYLSTPTEVVYVWFSVNGDGSDPGAADRGIEVQIGMSETANGVAAAVQAAVDLDAAFSATVSGNVVTVVNAVAGLTLFGSMDEDTGFTITNPVIGADATHTLQDKLLTLRNGAGTGISVGFSLAGNVGNIAVTLPPSTQTAAQIAALTQAAIHAHADFNAVQGTGGATAEVTVTNAAPGMTANASAGDTGFTVTTLTEGVSVGPISVLVDEALIASETGWRSDLPQCLAWIRHATSNQTIAASVASKILFGAGEQLGCPHYDSVESCFTVPRTGKYRVTLYANTGNATASRTDLRVYVNDARATDNEWRIERPARANDVMIGGSIVCQFTAGDRLTFFVWPESGTLTLYSGVKTYALIERLL